MVVHRYEIDEANIGQPCDHQTPRQPKRGTENPVQGSNGRTPHRVGDTSAEKSQRHIDDKKHGGIGGHDRQPQRGDMLMHPRQKPGPQIQGGEARRHQRDNRQGFVQKSSPDGVEGRHRKYQSDQYVAKGEGHDSILACFALGSGAKAKRSVTLVISVNLSPAPSILIPLGMNACLNPSLAASLSRASAWGTGRMSPESEISPKKTLSRGRGCPPRDEISAAAATKSQAGSEIFRPPAILR